MQICTTLPRYAGSWKIGVREFLVLGVFCFDRALGESTVSAPGNYWVGVTWVIGDGVVDGLGLGWVWKRGGVLMRL